MAKSRRSRKQRTRRERLSWNQIPVDGAEEELEPEEFEPEELEPEGEVPVELDEPDQVLAEESIELEAEPVVDESSEAVEAVDAEPVVRRGWWRRRKKAEPDADEEPREEVETETEPVDAIEPEPEPVHDDAVDEEVPAEPKRRRRRRKKKDLELAEEPMLEEAETEPVLEEAEPESAPRRRRWWRRTKDEEFEVPEEPALVFDDEPEMLVEADDELDDTADAAELLEVEVEVEPEPEPEPERVLDINALSDEEFVLEEHGIDIDAPDDVEARSRHPARAPGTDEPWELVLENLEEGDEAPAEIVEEPVEAVAPRRRRWRRKRRGRHAEGPVPTEHLEELAGEDELEDELEEEYEDELEEEYEEAEDEREAIGPRRAALKRRRRRKFLKGTLGAAALAAAVTAAAVGAAELADRNANDDDTGIAGAKTGLSAETGDTITTTLMFGTKEQSDVGDAVWMSLLSVDAARGKGSIIYIPAHTATEIPGRGLQPIGDALGTGGVPLLLVSAENLLGVQIDRYIELSDHDAMVLFESTGALTVDVPSEVSVGAGGEQTRLLFTSGPQELPPKFLTKLLFTVGVDGDDIELGTRHLAFWDALLDTFNADPSRLGQAIADAGPALSESDASIDEHAAFFGALAGLSQEDRLVTLLPARQLTVGGSELYETSASELAEFVAETIGPAAAPGEQVRVQILNGNGVPGIGQEVAERLIGHGFRVFLSGNAPRLDYAKTLVITYDPSQAGQALAERAKRLLGVGEVQVSAQPQGIVDLTIVVGKDFLRDS